MKNTVRILSLLFALMLSAAPLAHAETFDLSGMSYDELVALKNQINLAMWGCQEWQEVTVPQGVWKVGEDIPAGHWTVKCAPGAKRASVEWGEKLQDNNEDIGYYGRHSLYNTIYNPSVSSYSDSDSYMHSYSFEVRSGDYIVIEHGSVIFTPYIGKPDLGFK